jgi:hypothetical protein
VALHPMLGTHRQTDDVPTAHDRFPRPWLGPAFLLTHRFDDFRELSNGRDVDDQHAAWHERLRDGGQDVPWSQHVEYDAIDLAAVCFRIELCQIGDGQFPVRRTFTEEGLDVANRVFGMIVADLVGDDLALGSDGTQ